MDLKILYDGLKTVYPTTHIQWEKGKAPDYPYIAIQDKPSSNFGADDIVYYQCDNFVIQLYAKKKNYIVAEKNVEKFFNDNEIFWQKERNWLKDEQVFLTIYFI